MVIGIVPISQQYIRKFSNSPGKIIFYCSLEIIEGSYYVPKIKTPFNRNDRIYLSIEISFYRNKPSTFYFCSSKNLTLCLRRGDNKMQNQKYYYEKCFNFSQKKSGKCRGIHLKQECHWMKNGGKDFIIFMGRFNSFNEVMESFFYLKSLCHFLCSQHIMVTIPLIYFCS